MIADDEFALRLKGYSVVTVNVLYYMPDHRSLVQEFIWQTMDIQPKYPRVMRFLDHWRREVDAVVKEILLCDDPQLGARKVREITEYFVN